MILNLSMVFCLSALFFSFLFFFRLYILVLSFSRS